MRGFRTLRTLFWASHPSAVAGISYPENTILGFASLSSCGGFRTLRTPFGLRIPLKLRGSYFLFPFFFPPTLTRFFSPSCAGIVSPPCCARAAMWGAPPFSPYDELGVRNVTRLFCAFVAVPPLLCGVPSRSFAWEVCLRRSSSFGKQGRPPICGDPLCCGLAWLTRDMGILKIKKRLRENGCPLG